MVHCSLVPELPEHAPRAPWLQWLATSLEMTSRLLNLERGRMAAGGKGSAKTQAAVKTLSARSKKGRARR